MAADASGNPVDVGYNENTHSGVRFNAAQFRQAVASASGDTFKITGYDERTGTEKTYTFQTATATQRIQDELTDSQIDNWIGNGEGSGVTRTGGKSFVESIGPDGKLRASYDEAVAAARGGIGSEIGFDSKSRATFGAARGAATRKATKYRTDMKFVKRRANSQASKK